MYAMAKIGWHGTRKRANGRYQARWCDSEGVQSLGGFLSKAQAETHALNKAKEALNVMVGLAVFRKPIADARQGFLDRRTKENTRALNQRRLDEFLAAMPEIKDTSQLTRNLIDRYAGLLARAGHNSGGQEHHLRIVRAFCNFCVAQKWLVESPFTDFDMPKSDYEGRALNSEEWDRMVQPSRIPNQYKEVDWWLNRAFRLGYSGVLRISQVWKLQPKDFRAPNELWVEGIKDQEGEWKLLRPEAVAILQELLPGALLRGRFFHYWASVESMRNSVEDKARRVGLAGVRFHDVCKVTAVSDLAAKGYGPADLEHIANTSKRVLIEYYMKADRSRALARYVADQGGKAAKAAPIQGHTRATFGPNNQGFVETSGDQLRQESAKETVEKASISPSIPEV